MKWKFFYTALLAGAVSFLGACNEDDGVAPEPFTVLQIVNNTPGFSILRTAVEHAGLQDALQNSNPLTVFAPNDAAFTAAGIATPDAVRALPKETVANILLYHVLGAEVKAADVPAGPNAQVGTLGGKNISVTKNSNGVFVNGGKVITADVDAVNGVVHIINKVLMPPTGTIVDVAAGNPNFTFLVEAVKRAGLVGTLSGTGPFTVFAPTNDAFIAAGFPTLASIQNASPTALTPILTYHVIAGRVFSSDLSEGLQPTMVSGGKTTVTLSPVPRIRGNGNNISSNITTVDLVATNGVIHVIDRVLLP